MSDKVTVEIERTKRMRIIKAYLQNYFPPDLRDEKPEKLTPSYSEIKSFVIGLSGAELKNLMTEGPYAQTFKERVQNALDQEAAEFLEKHPETAPRQMNVGRVSGVVLDDVKPDEVSRG